MIGEAADLVAWAADPFSASRDRLEGIGVRLVVGSGRVVFSLPAPR